MKPPVRKVGVGAEEDEVETACIPDNEAAKIAVKREVREAKREIRPESMCVSAMAIQSCVGADRENRGNSRGIRNPNRDF